MADDDDWEGSGVAEVNALEKNVQTILAPLDISPKAYSKYPLHRLVQASYEGDLDLLEQMLDREDPISGYHHDINEHFGDVNALHSAAMSGQLEVVERLLKARADPHIKQSMPQGSNPKDGPTAREMADRWGWDDIVGVLKKAEEQTPVGYYMRYGTGNNMKLWPIDKPEGLDPHQERRARRKHKGLIRPLPSRSDRKFYGELVFGVTHGYDENGHIIRNPSLRVASGPMSGPDSDAAREAVAAAPEALHSSEIGVMFPSIGSQYKGMMANARGTSNPKIQEMVAAAERIAGFDVLGVCLGSGQPDLESVPGGEVAIYLASMAGVEALRQLRPEAVENPRAAAGLGVGEFSALTFAGVFDFETGMQLVKERAAAIEAASTDSPQLTISVAGLDSSRVAQLCAEVQLTIGECRLANELFPKGCTCAGSREAIEALRVKATEAGAIQTRVAGTLGAVHTPLMEPARRKVEAALLEVLPKWRPPRCDVFMTATGKRFPAGTDPKDLVAPLCDAMISTALWQTAVQAMIASGAAEFYEVGPMKQLQGMMKRIAPAVWSKTESVEF